MNLNIVVSTLTLFLTILLSFFVLLEDHRNSSNRYFTLLGFSIALWIANNVLTDLVHEYNLALYLSRLAIIWVAFLPLFFNSLIKSLYFHNDKDYLKKYNIMYVIMLFFIGIIIIFNQTNFNIDSITLLQDGIDYHPGLLYYLLFFHLFLGFSFSFYYLLKVFRYFIDVKKEQAKLMIIGTSIAVFLGIVTNIVFPLLGYSYLNVIGPPSVLFFICFTAIAVLKHHLFNVKVIATELLVFLLWIIILIRTIVSDTYSDLIINSGLLVLTVVIGIFLIRSVIKEVRQREHIELLATDLKKANVRLTELDRQKSEFVSFATHQLRSPLAAMKGYASLILEGDMGVLPEEAKSAVSRIYDSTNTLTSIVDDYLNVTRIELGSMKYAFETIDLKALVEDVIAELKPNIDKMTAVKFSFEAENSGTDYRITADRDKLKQVIVNLIDNSLKYTPKGSVNVKLSFDRNKRKFIFEIKDTGIGIASETLPHLFNKFSRAGNANKTNIRGTGLGLFVAKEMITAHHGTIRAESPGEGKGATFIVEMEPFGKA